MFSIFNGIFTQTLKREIWAEEDVTIVWHDMRTWEAPEKAGGQICGYARPDWIDPFL